MPVLQAVDNHIRGRLVLITGASGGIGSHCASAFASEGCDVALHYSSNRSSAEALAKKLQTQFPSQLFIPFQADLADRAATRNLVDGILSHQMIAPKHNAISILVANAGIGKRIRDIADIGEDDWDEMMEVNSRSQFVITKTSIARMRVQRWGRVILVGSIASRGSGLNGCHYAATKGSLTSMGLNLASLLAPEGITVNIVSPAMIGSTGMIPTPKLTSWEHNTDLEKLRVSDPGLAIAASIPVHRLGCPDEVSAIVLMLAKTGYLTGQDILVAGGLR